MKPVEQLEVLSCLALPSLARRGAPISSPLLGLIEQRREADQLIFNSAHGEMIRLPADPLYLLARLGELLGEVRVEELERGMALGANVPLLQAALQLRSELDDLTLIIGILRSLRRISRSLPGLKVACEQCMKQADCWEWFSRARETPGWMACLLEWPCLAKPTPALLQAACAYFATAKVDPYKAIKLAELMAAKKWSQTPTDLLEPFFQALYSALPSNRRLLKPLLAMLHSIPSMDFSHFPLLDQLGEVGEEETRLLWECYQHAHDPPMPIANKERALMLLSRAENVNVLIALERPGELLPSLKGSTLERLILYGRLFQARPALLAEIALPQIDWRDLLTVSAEERRRCLALLPPLLAQRIEIPEADLEALLQAEGTCRLPLLRRPSPRHELTPRCVCEVGWALSQNWRTLERIRSWLRYPEGVLWREGVPCEGQLWSLLSRLPVGEDLYLQAVFSPHPVNMDQFPWGRSDAILQRQAIRWHGWKRRQAMLLAREPPSWMEPDLQLEYSPPTECTLLNCVTRAILTSQLCSCLVGRFICDYSRLSIVEQVGLVTALHQLERPKSSQLDTSLEQVFRNVFPHSPTPPLHLNSLNRVPKSLAELSLLADRRDFLLLPPDWSAMAEFELEDLLQFDQVRNDHLFAELLWYLLSNACFYFDDLSRLIAALQCTRVRLWLEHYTKNAKRNKR